MSNECSAPGTLKKLFFSTSTSHVSRLRASKIFSSSNTFSLTSRVAISRWRLPLFWRRNYHFYTTIYLIPYEFLLSYTIPVGIFWLSDFKMSDSSDTSVNSASSSKSSCSTSLNKTESIPKSVSHAPVDTGNKNIILRLDMKEIPQRIKSFKPEISISNFSSIDTFLDYSCSFEEIINCLSYHVTNKNYRITWLRVHTDCWIQAIKFRWHRNRVILILYLNIYLLNANTLLDVETIFFTDSAARNHAHQAQQS